jgi:alkylation response protein AidB-like acyl-CoA dehydrogenase
VLRERGLLDDPVWRDRLMQLQGRMLSMKYHGHRLVTEQLKQRNPGISALIVKLVGCQLNYDLCELAIDALGEQGLLRVGSEHAVDDGQWQKSYMFALGLIIGGGTAQIQKNIISEVGLGMPREPKLQKSAGKGA